jgi:hypothetical protein
VSSWESANPLRPSVWSPSPHTGPQALPHPRLRVPTCVAPTWFLPSIKGCTVTALPSRPFCLLSLTLTNLRRVVSHFAQLKLLVLFCDRCGKTCGINLLGCCDFPVSASLVAGTTGWHHRAWLRSRICLFSLFTFVSHEAEMPVQQPAVATDVCWSTG